MKHPASVLILAVGLAGCAPDSEIPATIDAEGLVGTWVATLEHNGQQARIALTFDRGDDDTFAVTAAVPAIGAWSMPVGGALVKDDGSGVRTGLGELAWNAERGTLEAAGLPALVPVHAIDIVLEKSDPLEPEPRAELDAPAAEPAWTFDAGAALWSGCTYDDGTVFVGNDAGEVLAVDAARGIERWRSTTGGPVRARPTVAGTTVFVHSDDGLLYAFDRDSGGVVWKTPLREGAFERIPPSAEGSRYDHFASAATVADDTVFVGSGDGGLHAVDAATGKARWSYRAEDTVASTPAVDAGTVFVGSFDGKVHAVDAATGESVWTYDTGAAVPSSPEIADGRVLIGSRSYDLWALDAADGTPAWKFYYWFSWVDSDANVVDATAYIGSSDALRVYAIDTATGKPRWSTDVGGWAWARPAVGADRVFAGTVGVTGYIGERNGGLFALDRTTGKPLWRHVAEPVADGMWGFAGAPDVGAGKVYAGGIDGRLYAFGQ